MSGMGKGKKEVKKMEREAEKRSKRGNEEK